MKKFTRKLLSIMLTLAMVVTMVPAFGVTANAATDFTDWTKIDGTTTISESGSYYLDGDVTGNIIVESNVNATLDLNGHVLKADLTKDGNTHSVITNKGTLTVVDTATENNVHYFKVNADGLWELDTTINSGEKYIFDANYGLRTASGEYTKDIPKENSIIKVTGGCITGGNGNTVAYNAGYSSWENGQNASCGGGILNYGNLTVKDTTIIGNKVDSSGSWSTNAEGGGICSFSNELKLSGAAVVGNVSTCYGGGIFCRYGGNISKSKVCYNKTTETTDSHGGGIHNRDNTLTIEGSEIIGNTASGAGGGVTIYTPGKAYISNTDISRNEAKSSSGGIFNNGELTVSGIISENKAAWGAGICNKGIATLKDVTVTGNKSTYSEYLCPGGGVYSWEHPKNAADGVVLTLSGKVNITGNTTEYSSKTYDANLCLSGTTVNDKVKVEDLTSGSNIGVTVMVNDEVKSGAFTASGSTDYSSYFTSDSLAYKVKFNNKNTDDTNDDYIELAKYNITTVANSTEYVKLEKDNMTKEQAISIMTDDAAHTDGIVVYAVNGGKYSYLKYESGAWTKAGTKTLSDLKKESKAYVIGTAAIGSSDEAITIDTDNKKTQIQVSGDAGVQASGLENVAMGVKAEEAEEDVKIVLEVNEQNEEGATEALSAFEIAEGTNIQLLEINMKKVVGSDNEEKIYNTGDNIIELIVPFDTMGKENIKVYRYHEKSDSVPEVTEFVQKSKEEAGADGTFYIENNKLHMFTNKFSTYAIASTEVSNYLIKTLASVALGTTVAVLIERVLHKNQSSWISTLKNLFTRCFKTGFSWKWM